MASPVSCADARRTGKEHGKATEKGKAPAEILEIEVGGTVCLVRVFANTDCRETPKDMIRELIDQNTKYPFSGISLENLSDSTEIDSKNVQETPKPNYNIDSLNRFGSAEGGT